MAKNAYLSTIESKKQNKQVKHNDRYRKHLMISRWEGVRGMGKNTNEQLQNRHGNIEYSIGTTVAKEHRCMTHGC